MIQPIELALGALVPLATATFVFAAAWRWLPRGGAWTAGVVAGFAAGVFSLDGNKNGWKIAAEHLIRASQSHEWLPLVALAATAPAILALAAKRRWLELVAAAPLCALAPLLLLWKKYQAVRQLRDAGFADDALSPMAAAAVLGVIAVSLWISWWLWMQAEGSPLSRTRSFLAIATLVGSAAASALTGSLVYGQLFGVLAASLGGCAAAAWLLGADAGPESSRGPALLVTAGLLSIAVVFSELAAWQAAALGAAMAFSVGWLPFTRRASVRLHAGVRGVFCLALVAIVLWRAFSVFQANEQSASDPSASDYDYFGE
jgi:hypothetical protein